MHTDVGKTRGALPTPVMHRVSTTVSQTPGTRMDAGPARPVCSGPELENPSVDAEFRDFSDTVVLGDRGLKKE